MRSIKGIIIGFLLILLGFAVTSYSLIAGGVLAAAGLAAVVIFALPKQTQQPQAEQPPAPAPEPEDPAPELRPEALPDILTDPPAQKKPEPPPAADAQTLFGTLAEAYTRIDELTCRGPAWMLERDIRLCRAFCERWEAAVKDPVFASFVRAKARYADYTDEFLLPGFGKRGRIHGRRTSGELLDDLTAAVKKRASRQESALQSALRAEQWFESICRQLRRVQPAVQEGAAGEAVQGPLPQPSALRTDTPLQTLDTFCVLALKTTGKHPGRDELVQLSALKFRRFAPETIICMQSYNWPGNIRELHNVVERMMIISKNNVIQPEELPITDNITISQKESEEYFEQVNLHKLVEQLEISYIRRAYSRYGNVRDAARSLGMDASTFVRKRKKIEQGRE